MYNKTKTKTMKLPNLTESQARLLLWVGDLEDICSDVNDLEVFQIEGTFKVEIKIGDYVIKTLKLDDYKKVINK